MNGTVYGDGFEGHGLGGGSGGRLNDSGGCGVGCLSVTQSGKGTVRRNFGKGS